MQKEHVLRRQFSRRWRARAVARIPREVKTERIGCARALAPLWLGCVCCGVLAYASEVRAENAEKAVPRSLFEIGLGALLLPGAEVCSFEGCLRTDGTPSLEFRAVFRTSRRLSWGGALTWGFFPASTPPAPELSDLSHSRAYLGLELLARHLWWSDRERHVWFQPAAGVLVLSDRFVTQPLVENRALRIGDPGQQLRSEAAQASLGWGYSQTLSPTFGWGVQAKVGAVLFPSSPALTGLGQRASLDGFHPFLGLSIVASMAGPM